MNAKQIVAIILCLLGVLGSKSVAIPNYQEQFLKANNLYKEQKFQKAYDLYQDIKNKSPQVNYNLGNCAYRLNKFGYALLYWRRAERDWGIFNREELLENISLVKNKLDQKAGAEKKGPFPKLVGAINFIMDIILSFVRSVSLLWLQLLFLLMWCVLFMYMRSSFRHKQKVLTMCLVVLTVFLGTLLALKYNMSFRSYGVVVAEKTELLTGPDDSYQVLGFLPEGKEGIIKKESGEYYKVKIGGQIGWVTRKSFEKI